MGTSIKPLWTETLPEPLPANPLEIVVQWLAEAQIGAAQPNPNAMVLATVNEHGQPSARVVLCKGIVPEKATSCSIPIINPTRGAISSPIPAPPWFFTGTTSDRQVRAEGRVERCPAPTTTPISIPAPGRAASAHGPAAQSAPVESRIAMEESVAAAARRFGIPYGGPGSPEPETVPVRRCLARLTGADIA